MSSLKKKAAHGASWTAISSASLAILQFGQVAVLTAFLDPRDFGLKALVTAYVDTDAGNAN